MHNNEFIYGSGSSLVSYKGLPFLAIISDLLTDPIGVDQTTDPKVFGYCRVYYTDV